MRVAMKLHVVEPPPARGERAALVPDNLPVFVGTGSHCMECGSCGALLGQQIWEHQFFDLGIICPRCGGFNDTPSAAGRIISSNCIFYPCGQYFVHAPMRVLPHALVIGELFPGAGPPGRGGVVGTV